MITLSRKTKREQVDDYSTIYLQVDEAASVTDIATNGNASNNGFKFTGLIIGNMYELKMAAHIIITGSSSTEFGSLIAVHNGATLLRVENRVEQNADTVSQRQGMSRYFQATATEITFDFNEGGSVSLLGNGTIDETWAQLAEANGKNPESNKFTP